MMRLGAMLGLMVIIVMLIARFRDPEMWRWFARQRDEAGRIEHVGDPSNGAIAGSPSPEQSGQASPSPASATESGQPASAPAKPAVEPSVSQAEETDPQRVTDEDPDEWNEAQEEFQAVLDGQTDMRPEEWNSYRRVLAWVENQSAETLLKRAKRNVPFNDFLSRPDEHRGKIYALKLDVKLCRRFPNPVDEDLILYEAWGVTRQSKVFLYDGVILDPPKGFPISDTEEISEKATLVGYFYKLQGYLPSKAKLGQPPERAPMFIGRLIWKPAPPPPTSKHEWFLGVVVGCIAAGTLVIGWLFTRMGRVLSPSEAILAASRGNRSIPVDDWLESPETTDDTPHTEGRNISQADSELDEDVPRGEGGEEGQPRNGLDEGRSHIG